MSPLAAALKRLLDCTEDPPSSRFTQSQCSALDDFALRTGSVRRIRKGAGSIYKVVDRDLSLLHLRKIAPGLVLNVPDDVPNRARNIALTRSSKSGPHGHGCYHLVLKPIGISSSWVDGSGTGFDLAAATAATGATMLPVRPDDEWVTDGDLWLVENQGLYDRVNWLPDDANGSLAYFNGEIHGTLLRWFHAKRRAGRIVLFADYDGNGLSNFERLARFTAANEVVFWLFPGWEAVLETYGSAALHQANLTAFLAAQTALTSNPGALLQVQGLIDRITTSGKSLEQEAVWLSGGFDQSP